MIITKKEVISLLFIATLIILLPLAIFLTKNRQDIRPRALQGKANLQMNASSTKTAVGENINVMLSLYLTDAKLRVSGADIVVLYEKDKLDPINVVPAVKESGGPFTDAPIVSSGGNFDNVYNFLRISEVARKTNNDLSPTDGTSTVSLGMVTFKAKSEGQAVVKYPDDNKYLEIVGISSDNVVATPTTPANLPTATPGNNPTATPVSGQTDAVLSIEPETTQIQVGSAVDYKLVARFNTGSVSKKLDYFKTELTFPKGFIEIPSTNPYVSTVDSGFLSIFRVDSNIAANQNGKIVIELGADKAGNGPTTDKDITIAKWKMKGIAATNAAQTISVGATEMVWYLDGQAKDLTLNPINATFNVAN